MKIKKDIYLGELEKYRYKYQENLIYPTYKKIFKCGKINIIIEIVIQNRTIFINHNEKIKKSHLKYIEELKRANLIEQEKKENK